MDARDTEHRLSAAPASDFVARSGRVGADGSEHGGRGCCPKVAGSDVGPEAGCVHRGPGLQLRPSQRRGSDAGRRLLPGRKALTRHLECRGRSDAEPPSPASRRAWKAIDYLRDVPARNNKPGSSRPVRADPLSGREAGLRRANLARSPLTGWDMSYPNLAPRTGEIFRDPTPSTSAKNARIDKGSSRRPNCHLPRSNCARRVATLLARGRFCCHNP